VSFGGDPRYKLVLLGGCAQEKEQTASHGRGHGLGQGCQHKNHDHLPLVGDLSVCVVKSDANGTVYLYLGAGRCDMEEQSYLHWPKQRK
jgi:hypothetical protein